MKKLMLSLCLSLACAAAAMADTYLGYTNTHFERTGGVRLGNSEKQGLAIKLTSEKLDRLRGKRVLGVRAVFGTSNMDGLEFFVATSLDGEPLYSQAFGGGSPSWKEFRFDTPVDIGDADELYVGYTLTCMQSYKPLQFDGSKGLSGRSFYYTGSGWFDCQGNGADLGCPNIQVIVDDADFTDITLKDLSAGGYYVAGQTYGHGGQVLNFGTVPIGSFDVSFSIGGGEPLVRSFTELDIAPGQTFDFDLGEYAAGEAGNLDFELSVTAVNGAATDADPADNSVAQAVYVYPAGMRHSLLLEGFTGQMCDNCPAGHQAIAEALASYGGDVVEVFHHVGFTPDDFTMAEESFYLNFFSGQQGFAPSFMVNRMTATGNQAPAQSPNVGSVIATLMQAASVQPYVSVEVNTDYDEARRHVKGSVDVFTHVMPDADTVMVSLFVVQDSILTYQVNGGSAYAHRYAYRGSLYGQVGVRADLAEGATVSLPVDYVLPDAIQSTYSGTLIPTDPDRMYLVAIVSRYLIAPDGTYDCPVYNAAMVPMCADNHTAGIGGVASAPDLAPVVAVDGGRVSVSGDCSRAEVFDSAGRLVRSGSGGSVFSLPRGLYVVRASGCGGSVVRKVAVR